MTDALRQPRTFFWPRMNTDETRKGEMVLASIREHLPSAVSASLRLCSSVANSCWGQRRAFTLVELLVVLAIVGILAALIFPAFQRSAASTKAAACLANLRQIGVGLNAYLQEHDMIMPVLQIARASSGEDVPVIDNTLDRYLPDRRVFACPADHKDFAGQTGTSYAWNIALNGQPLASLNFMQLATDPSRIPILSDKEGFHPYLNDKINILYADGHATKDAKFFTGN